MKIAKFAKVALTVFALVLFGTATAALAGGGQGNPALNGWSLIVSFSNDVYQDPVNYVTGYGNMANLTAASKNFGRLKVSMYGIEDSNSATIFTCENIHIGSRGFTCASALTSEIATDGSAHVTRSYYLTVSQSDMLSRATQKYVYVKLYSISVKDGSSVASVSEVANSMHGLTFYIYAAKQ